MRLARTAAALFASLAALPAAAHVAAKAHGHPHVEEGAFGAVELAIAGAIIVVAVAAWAWDRRSGR